MRHGLAGQMHDRFGVDDAFARRGFRHRVPLGDPDGNIAEFDVGVAAQSVELMLRRREALDQSPADESGCAGNGDVHVIFRISPPPMAVYGEALRNWWDRPSAGINRHAIGNERILQERSSESILPRILRRAS